MSGHQANPKTPREAELRARNLRLGLILGSIAMVFFFGVVLKYTLLR